jgi:hypothetical protein
MCFYVDAENPVEMVAATDIPCFKVLKHDMRGAICAPIQHCFFYFRSISLRRRRRVRSILNPSEVERYGTIDEGLHSYSTYDKAYKSSYGYCVHRAYIPKGARYWYNSESEEYVSDRLVVTRKKISIQSE